MSGLFTDLYELTMIQAYLEEGMNADAVFSLYTRRMPAHRNFLLNCGLDTVLGCLESLRFSDEDIAYLRSLGKFNAPFFDWLRDFRFTGDVYAIAEGTPVFGNEPVLELVAPLPQAQLVETLVMNQIHLQTVLASKAQRIAAAACGRPVLDFGARRTHGFDAALKAVRAFMIGGVAATSNVYAGQIYGVPVAGTMAHSYIQAHDDESEAFRAFARLYPDTVMLVDTYDTLAGVRKVIELSQELGDAFRVKAVRLDSGDLGELARVSRRLLDEAGLQRVQIIASGGLDEHAIADLVTQSVPIDGFGVGTSMGVSEDAPTLDIAYKLCEYAGKGRLKLSSGKPVLPGRKQVFRVSDEERDVRDVIARAGETLPGMPLLECVMRGGKRVGKRTGLEAIRSRARVQIARLPAQIQALKVAESPYPVEVSAALSKHQTRVRKQVGVSA